MVFRGLGFGARGLGFNALGFRILGFRLEAEKKSASPTSPQTHLRRVLAFGGMAPLMPRTGQTTGPPKELMNYRFGAYYTVRGIKL